MGEIVYAVHVCKTPEVADLGLGSVYKCECGKLFELSYFPKYSSLDMPTFLGWQELAPRWFDEATQTPVPQHQRIVTFETVEKTKWQRFVSRMRRSRQW